MAGWKFRYVLVVNDGLLSVRVKVVCEATQARATDDPNLGNDVCLLSNVVTDVFHVLVHDSAIRRRGGWAWWVYEVGQCHQSWFRCAGVLMSSIM